jgi:hypothetical protein
MQTNFKNILLKTISDFKHDINKKMNDVMQSLQDLSEGLA